MKLCPHKKSNVDFKYKYIQFERLEVKSLPFHFHIEKRKFADTFATATKFL